MAGCQASRLTLPASVSFLKGDGQQAEEEETEKQTAGRRFPFDLRRGKYLLIHS